MWLALVFGVIGLADGLVSLLNLSLMEYYGWVISVIAFLFFFFNIFALVYFKQERLEKITWVLPIYHIASYILFFGLGIFLGLAGLFLGGVVGILGVIGVVTSVLEIIFCVYLLRRFRFL